MVDFGKVLTAMITPFKADGSVNYDVAAELAAHLDEEVGRFGKATIRLQERGHGSSKTPMGKSETI